uniref:Uncharacterized protein n=1 Tax=Strigamia maritima TaxID=126957 RepID=T1IHQ5_STRMM
MEVDEAEVAELEGTTSEESSSPNLEENETPPEGPITVDTSAEVVMAMETPEKSVIKCQIMFVNLFFSSVRDPTFSMFTFVLFIWVSSGRRHSKNKCDLVTTQAHGNGPRHVPLVDWSDMTTSGQDRNKQKAQLSEKKGLLRDLDTQIVGQLEQEPDIIREVENSEIYQERLVDQIQDLTEIIDEARRAKELGDAAVITAENQARIEAAIKDQLVASQQAIAGQLRAQIALQGPNGIVINANAQPENDDTVVKLPVLTIEKFSGNPTQWNEFWSHFTLSVEENRKVKPKAKLVYLKSLLTGPALSVVAGLEVSEANFVTAKELLTERFGKKSVVIGAHFKALDHLVPIKK